MILIQDRNTKPEILKYGPSLRGPCVKSEGLVFHGTARAIRLRLQLHDAIYRPDSFVWILRYCANLKAIRYESTSLNRIVADKSHRVIVA